MTTTVVQSSFYIVSAVHYTTYLPAHISDSLESEEDTTWFQDNVTKAWKDSKYCKKQ